MFTKTPGWGWLMLLAGIFGGLLIGKIAKGLLRNMAERFDMRDWGRRATAIRSAASPTSLALLTVGMMIGLRSIYLLASVQHFANQVFKFLLMIALGWFMYNVVEVFTLTAQKMADKTDSKLDDQLVPLLRKTARVFVVVVFVLFVAENVFGMDITAWLAGLGLAGLAVSLAAQDSIKNLFGSLTIFFDKPFQVGDRVVFSGYDCTIEEIGFRSTKARTSNGHIVTIPNMKFIDTPVENIAARPSIKRVMNVGITYDTPPKKIEQAIGILKDILNEPEIIAPFDMEKSPPRVAFNELNADNLNIMVLDWFMLNEDHGCDYLDHCQTINMKLIKAYDKAGIEFAFPTQTVYLAGDAARKLNEGLGSDALPDSPGPPGPVPESRSGAVTAGSSKKPSRATKKKTAKKKNSRRG